MDKMQHFLERHNNPDLQLKWQGSVLNIRLNRPDRKNALNGKIIKSLQNIFLSINSYTDIRTIIIEGGEHQFCSGADLQEIAAIKQNGGEAIYQNNKNFGELLHSIYVCPAPVIALVDGPALGGGMGLACASDLILCTKNASFGMPEPRLGIIAGQIFPFVFHKLGLVRSQEMALQGIRIDGRLASEWQLVNGLYDNYLSLRSAADTICSNIISCGPEAIRSTKRLIQKAAPLDSGTIESIARTVTHATLSTEGLEGNMAFMEKRKPNWTLDIQKK